MEARKGLGKGDEGEGLTSSLKGPGSAVGR